MGHKNDKSGCIMQILAFLFLTSSNFLAPYKSWFCSCGKFTAPASSALKYVFTGEKSRVQMQVTAMFTDCKQEQEPPPSSEEMIWWWVEYFICNSRLTFRQRNTDLSDNAAGVA